jgi:hypothetical protein
MDTVLAWILPEFFVSSFGISRRRVALILGATLTFVAAVGVACLLLLSKEEQTARDSATRFGIALVQANPGAAPPGAAEYVSGVRNYFGTVTSARVIGAHNKGVNTGDNADTRSFFVVQMLLHSRRGPAVIEVEYDNHAMLSQKVSRIYELDPSHAPGLSNGEHQRLATALAARGGEAANSDDLTAPAVSPSAGMDLKTPATPRPAKPHIVRLGSTPQGAQLRCVQRAHGDVQKMQRCANP